MEKIELGNELCEYITDTLNNIIITTGRKIEKNNEQIWKNFLHIIDNDHWDAMFAAFKHKVATSDQLLRHDQQDKFDRAYTTFKRDSQLYDRCMDIKSKSKGIDNKDPAWAMIMTIRELWNACAGRDIPNVDQEKKPEPKTPRQIREYRREYNITIQERLFELWLYWLQLWSIKH